MNKTELKIYELLKQRATSKDQDGTFCIYPIKELANNGEVSEITVKRTLNELEINFYILRKRQGRGREQKIYLLKNDTSINCEELKNDTSTNCEELKNVHSASCEELKNDTSTKRVEEISTILKNGILKPKNPNIKHFGMVHQNSATNALTKIKPKEGVNVTVDMFTGIAEMKKGGLTVVMKQFREINIRTSAFMLYDFLVMRLTENGAKSPVISVSLDDYMNIRGLQNTKEAREQVKEDLETLYNISISFEEKRRGGSKSFHDLRVLSDKGIKNGIINISFGMGFYSMLVNCPVMPYCKEIFKLDTNKYRHAYALYGKIQEHKNMNIGKKNENIISVKTLLDAASGIPTYDEVMKKNRAINENIIEPFQENMNALAPMITWEYCNIDGTSLYNTNSEIDYQTFINLNVRVTWLEYPDQTKRLETKAQRIAEYNKKSSKKRKKKDEK